MTKQETVRESTAQCFSALSLASVIHLKILYTYERKSFTVFHGNRPRQKSEISRIGKPDGAVKVWVTTSNSVMIFF